MVFFQPNPSSHSSARIQIQIQFGTQIQKERGEKREETLHFFSLLASSLADTRIKSSNRAFLQMGQFKLFLALALRKASLGLLNSGKLTSSSLVLASVSVSTSVSVLVLVLVLTSAETFSCSSCASCI